jgi:hypothetical protein
MFLIGALLGVYATTNGGDGEFETYVENWEYVGQGQIVDNSTTASR